MNILQAIDDPNLFKPWFKNASWAGWRAWLAALFGLPMSPADLELFHDCTGRSVAPTAPAREGWLVCGRRAGKSFILALIAVYLATVPRLQPSTSPLVSVARLLILAADRKQSTCDLPLHLRAVEAGTDVGPAGRERARRVIRPHQPHHDRGWHPRSYRTTRGYTFVAVLCDELAFWRSDDSASLPTTKSSTPSVLAWRLSRMPCCCAARRPMPGVVRSTTRIRSITARMVR